MQRNYFSQTRCESNRGFPSKWDEKQYVREFTPRIWTIGNAESGRRRLLAGLRTDLYIESSFVVLLG